MAIPADTVWEVETTGSDLNGGGFSTASKGATGVDMTYGGSAGIVSFTSTLSAVGTTTLTDSGAGFVNTMLGNVINIVGQGFYCITGFTSTSIVTVDRALGTFTTTSGKVGGACASPAIIGAVITTGNTVYIKAGTYTITAATLNVSAGCFSTSNNSIIVGFTSNRTIFNTDVRPYLVLNAGVTSATIFAGAAVLLINVSLDGASQTSSRGSSCNNYNCLFANFTNNASSGFCIFCEVAGCSTAVVISGSAIYCVAHGNSSQCFNSNTLGCIAYANTATPFGVNGATTINCIAVLNTGGSTDGFTMSGNSGSCINCIAESNGRYGFNISTSINKIIFNCSTFGNSSSAFSGSQNQFSNVVTGVSAFIDAAHQDFRLNEISNGGKLLRSLGFPTTWPSVNVNMLNYLDIGAAQHMDNFLIQVSNMIRQSNVSVSSY